MQTRRRVAFGLALVTPLVVVAVLAYNAIAGDNGSELRVAETASGGAFHPVAGGFVPDDSTVEGCEGDYSCLQQAFGNITYHEGATPALAYSRSRSR